MSSITFAFYSWTLVGLHWQADHFAILFLSGNHLNLYTLFLIKYNCHIVCFNVCFHMLMWEHTVIFVSLYWLVKPLRPFRCHSQTAGRPQRPAAGVEGKAEPSEHQFTFHYCMQFSGSHPEVSLQLCFWTDEVSCVNKAISEDIDS